MLQHGFAIALTKSARDYDQPSSHSVNEINFWKKENHLFQILIFETAEIRKGGMCNCAYKVWF